MRLRDLHFGSTIRPKKAGEEQSDQCGALITTHGSPSIKIWLSECIWIKSESETKSSATIKICVHNCRARKLTGRFFFDKLLKQAGDIYQTSEEWHLSSFYYFTQEWTGYLGDFVQ